MMKEVFLLSGHSSEVLYSEWHPLHTNHLVTSDVEGKICYWVLPNTVPSDTKIHLANNYVPTCTFDKFGDFMVSLSHDKSIKIWELN